MFDHETMTLMEYRYKCVPTIVNTKPIAGQKPGTSGLRKPVETFRQDNYVENFIQCILDAALGDNKKGASLVVGGDGRYYSPLVLQQIFRIAAANGISQLIVGYNGLMSTPAVSLAIREFKADGGIILTASHNPGGEHGDFGIKYNGRNGGPAPESLTEKIYELTTKIKKYEICFDLAVNYRQYGLHRISIEGVGKMTIEVFDSVKHYADRMERMFDFYLLKSLFAGTITGTPFRLLVDSMFGVTGPYVKMIFRERLGSFTEDLLNCDPAPDFCNMHPDPNLTYAARLVEEMEVGIHDMGVAFDGDGDRNMIIGNKGFFVCPSDSLAILALHCDSFLYFKDRGGAKGFARSMPTAPAVDRVAKKLGRECFETPTGWKFFGNLMDAGRISLCGEESFGTGCSYIREKDGIWSALAWLTVVARSKKTVVEVIHNHWATFGRNVFSRYDYEGCDAAECGKMMAKVEEKMNSAGFVGSSFTSENKTFVVSKAVNFSYTDPIDGSVSKNQGLCIHFADESRIVYRLSGTGSSGATARIYMDGYVDNPEIQQKPAKELLKPLIELALQLADVNKYTGRDKPTVIT